jgi:hypothetical protein
MTRFTHRSLAPSQQDAAITAPTRGVGLGRGDQEDGIVQRRPGALASTGFRHRILWLATGLGLRGADARSTPGVQAAPHSGAGANVKASGTERIPHSDVLTPVNDLNRGGR